MNSLKSWFIWLSWQKAVSSTRSIPDTLGNRDSSKRGLWGSIKSSNPSLSLTPTQELSLTPTLELSLTPTLEDSRRFQDLFLQVTFKSTLYSLPSTFYYLIQFSTCSNKKGRKRNAWRRKEITKENDLDETAKMLYWNQICYWFGWKCETENRVNWGSENWNRGKERINKKRGKEME